MAFSAFHFFCAYSPSPLNIYALITYSINDSLTKKHLDRPVCYVLLCASPNDEVTYET
ncbi:hypothetical protein VCHA41O245_30112 [Vibrio chagasii]|nr:hypothetical protein VCHA41O245_30112 [Vibrio chagasii]